MTIRYTCTGCESVLKIKDEKAGTKGKCPKCKAEFLVPDPDVEDKDLESEPEAAAQADEEPADLVDMPIELTPEVAEPEKFDPLSVLGGPAGAGTGRSPGAGRSDFGDRKASVADMMRDFESSKKKDREKKAYSESPRPSAASSAMETAGTAAEALSKAYQQKRESASSPSKTAKDIKAAEERALLSDFILKKAGPAAVLILAMLYGYWTWMTAEAYIGPPLFEVTGQVMRSGAPAAGIQVSFEPISEGPEDIRTVVWATCDPEGNFRLMYDASHFGAPAGNYNIGFMNIAGLPVARAEGALTITVSASESNVFKINL